MADDLYMRGRGVIDRTQELNRATWDAVPLAWLGVSAGGCMALGAIFWRFVVYPPRLVIRYGDGDEVWSFGGRLIRDGMPEVGFGADLLCAILVVVGVAIAVACNEPWRRAMKTLREHRERMDAETAKRGKGWASS